MTVTTIMTTSRITTTRYRQALAAAVLLILIAGSYAVWQFEHILQHGRIVRVELAPVDPRSIMQGDYMALAFAVDRQLPAEARYHRYAWFTLDDQHRATLLQLAGTLPSTGPQTAAPTVALLLRDRDGIISIGPNAFFFEEGSAAVFEQAKWGEFRVDNKGKALLTRLLDANLQPLGKNKR